MARQAYKFHDIVIPQADDPTKTISKDNYTSQIHHSEAGMIGFDGTDKTLVTDELPVQESFTVIRGEGASADNFDFVLDTDVADKDLFYFLSGAETITVRHDQSPGAGQLPIVLIAGVNKVLSTTVPLVCFRIGSKLFETAPTNSVFLDKVNIFTANQNLNGNSLLWTTGGITSVETGNQLIHTVKDDTANAGLVIKNTDGSIQLINGSGVTGNFSPIFRGIVALAANSTIIDSLVPVAQDSGAVPMFQIRAFQDDGTDLVTRPILSIQNFVTKLWEMDKDGNIDHQGNNLTNVGLLNLGAAVILTIASGSVVRTQTYHSIDTEASAATDDLDTVTGLVTGDLLNIRSVSDARDTTLKNAATGTGEMFLTGDFTLDRAVDNIMLIAFGVADWVEVSRSNNA